MAPSLTDRPVLVCRPRPNRRLSLTLLLAVVLLSVLALLLPGVHGARALDDVKEGKAAEAMHAAAARWSVTVREGGGHGVGHAHSGGTGHGSGHGHGHGRPESAGHSPHRRSAAPARDLGPSMAASCALLAAAAVALLCF